MNSIYIPGVPNPNPLVIDRVVYDNLSLSLTLVGSTYNVPGATARGATVYGLSGNADKMLMAVAPNGLLGWYNMFFRFVNIG